MSSGDGSQTRSFCYVDDPKVRQPDITRAKQLLEWEPEIELGDGLKRTIDESGIERLVGAPR